VVVVADEVADNDGEASLPPSSSALAAAPPPSLLPSSLLLLLLLLSLLLLLVLLVSPFSHASGPSCWNSAFDHPGGPLAPAHPLGTGTASTRSESCLM
jgi:hypothetical protein